MSTPFTSKANIVSFASHMTDGLALAEADISDDMLNSTTDIINYRTDTTWDSYTGDLYVDGRGEDFIFSPIVPIVSLSALKIIDIDTTEESLTLTGTSRQVWWNDATGQISRVDLYGEPTIERDPYYGEVFPRGVKNIKITGVFGKQGLVSAAVLAMLQTLLVVQLLRFKYPGQFNTDLIMERIGDYEYRIGDQQYAKDPKNAKKTLEGMIEYLFDSLPKDGKLYVLAV